MPERLSAISLEMLDDLLAALPETDHALCGGDCKLVILLVEMIINPRVHRGRFPVARHNDRECDIHFQRDGFA